ncbi:A disintegrin and metalloproteinase with thrombospondin motifs 12 [Galemys pyrenaicus]|uniref:A disintegrin and metalloproteinase with thrombospondin motifs 12 n=1 Tax=Galemys pyrenaicus TaxID=202257 RepID=A0A8J6DM02_GALPY|nr:A disintegrin and metalloproteinase with thrombospondin motifs 12 [Galemys pyrenaicus]
MPCAQRSWLADFSVVAQLLNLGTLCYGRQPQPGPVRFPDRRQGPRGIIGSERKGDMGEILQIWRNTTNTPYHTDQFSPKCYSVSPFLLEHFISALPEYQVVGPVRVDASGHFLSYGLHHPITNSRRKRDVDGPEDRVYYQISHEEKDLFFNLTINQGFHSQNYIVERRYGNLSHVKMVTSSAPPCHLQGTVLQQGTRIGTAALSACHGLVSACINHLLPLPPHLGFLGQHAPTSVPPVLPAQV